MFGDRISVSNDVNEIVTLHGRVKSGIDSLSEPMLLRIQHPRYDRTQMSCEFITRGSYEGATDIRERIKDSHEKGITIQSIDNPDFFCQLWAVTGSGYDATGVRINANWYDIGYSSWEYYQTYGRKDIDDCDIQVNVELAPSDILTGTGSPTWYPDGTITRDGDDGILSWSTHWGSIEASHRFSYENARIGENDATMQIGRPAFSIQVRAAERCASPHELFEFLDAEIADACKVLAFCFRRPVAWYDIKPLVMHKDISSAAFPLPRRRRVHYARPDAGRLRGTEPLIERRCLIGGAIGTLIDNYRRANAGSDLERTIGLIVAAHGAESVETRFFLCQVALEGLVNSIIVQNPGWLRNRQSLAQKIQLCVDHFNVPVDDIWKGTSFADGMKEAISGRNSLFHGETPQDFGKLYGSLVRLRTLVERLLIAALDWPRDKIWPRADDELKLLLV